MGREATRGSRREARVAGGGAQDQDYDVKNRFVMDGACYPSPAGQNPTLTFMALTVRACDHPIERFRKNEV
jgi:choline dehydrogenase-like flavoprotein